MACISRRNPIQPRSEGPARNPKSEQSDCAALEWGLSGASRLAETADAVGESLRMAARRRMVSGFGLRTFGIRVSGLGSANWLPRNVATTLHFDSPALLLCWRFGRLAEPRPGRSASKSPPAFTRGPMRLSKCPMRNWAGSAGRGWSPIPQGAELPWQATERGLLFPATLIPGELPEYRVAADGRRQHQLRQPDPLPHFGP